MVRQIMNDMISHNYDRFSKSGSSSAYSGFMARKSPLLSNLIYTYLMREHFILFLWDYIIYVKMIVQTSII